MTAILKITTIPEILELSLGEVIVANPLSDHAWARASWGGVSIYIYIYIHTVCIIFFSDESRPSLSVSKESHKGDRFFFVLHATKLCRSELLCV